MESQRSCLFASLCRHTVVPRNQHVCYVLAVKYSCQFSSSTTLSLTVPQRPPDKQTGLTASTADMVTTAADERVDIAIQMCQVS